MLGPCCFTLGQRLQKRGAFFPLGGCFGSLGRFGVWSKIRPLVGLLCVGVVVFYAGAEFHGSWPFLQGGFFGEGLVWCVVHGCWALPVLPFVLQSQGWFLGPLCDWGCGCRGLCGYHFPLKAHHRIHG